MLIKSSLLETCIPYELDFDASCSSGYADFQEAEPTRSPRCMQRNVDLQVTLHSSAGFNTRLTSRLTTENLINWVEL